MEVHQLRYFIAVAEENNFCRAAERVHVAQPSLSQQVLKLEAELGQPLFDRLPRSVVLTEAGRRFLPCARRILASLADARRCVDELKGEAMGRLVVGAIPTIAPYMLPELLTQFHKQYPKVILEVVEDLTDHLVRKLDEGEIDLALVSTCRGGPNLHRHPLGTEPLLAALPASHPLAQRERLNWTELKSERFLELHEMHCLAQQIRGLCAARRLRPEVALHGVQLGTIIGMITMGLGISLVPKMLADRQPFSGCVFKPLAAPVPARELNLIRNPARHFSKAAAAFSNLASAAFGGGPEMASGQA